MIFRSRSLLRSNTTPVMQNVVPLSHGHPMRQLTGLARQIALPAEHAPLRFPSFPALERTAVMGFNQPITLPIAAGQSVRVINFRQACYPAWSDSGGSPSPPGFVNFVSFKTNVESLQTIPAGTTLNTKFSMSPYPTGFVIANAAATSTTPGVAGAMAVPYQPQPLLGADLNSPGEWVYSPGGASAVIVHITSGAVTTATTATVLLEKWFAPGQWIETSLNCVIAAASSSGANVGSTVLPVGWWRVRSVDYSFTGATTTIGAANVWLGTSTYTTASFLASAGTPGIVTLGGAVNSLLLPLSYPVEFGNSRLPWEATRVTASAFLGTNVTQVLNKGGTILAGRLSPAIINAFGVSSSDIANLHPAEKAFLPMETGVYTYCPPSTDLVFFCDYSTNGSGGVNAPLFILSNDSLYNAMILTCPVASSLACTITWHMEFRTSSSLFQIGLSGMTLETLHQAQLVLSESGYFFENPEHKPLLNRIIATAKKYAPDVVSMASPMAGRMLQSMISKTTVKPRNGPMKVKGTSAKSSGITTGAGGKGKKGPKPPGKKAQAQKKGKRR